MYKPPVLGKTAWHARRDNLGNAVGPDELARNRVRPETHTIYRAAKTPGSRPGRQGAPRDVSEFNTSHGPATARFQECARAGDCSAPPTPRAGQAQFDASAPPIHAAGRAVTLLRSPPATCWTASREATRQPPLIRQARARRDRAARRSPRPGAAPRRTWRCSNCGRARSWRRRRSRRTHRRRLAAVKPPYGILSAINLDRGEIVWQVPHGDTPDNVRNSPLLRGLNIPKTGQVEPAVSDRRSRRRSSSWATRR
jgi:hypothetical protein